MSLFETEVLLEMFSFRQLFEMKDTFSGWVSWWSLGVTADVSFDEPVACSECTVLYVPWIGIQQTLYRCRNLSLAWITTAAESHGDFFSYTFFQYIKRVSALRLLLKEVCRKWTISFLSSRFHVYGFHPKDMFSSTSFVLMITFSLPTFLWGDFLLNIFSPFADSVLVQLFLARRTNPTHFTRV